MPRTELFCLSRGSAQAVVDEFTLPGFAGDSNTVARDGTSVVIGYFDKRYPLDVASWAYEHGHASDDEAASTIARI